MSGHTTEAWERAAQSILRTHGLTPHQINATVSLIKKQRQAAYDEGFASGNKHALEVATKQLIAVVAEPPVLSPTVAEPSVVVEPTPVAAVTEPASPPSEDT